MQAGEVPEVVIDEVDVFRHLPSMPRGLVRRLELDGLDDCQVHRDFLLQHVATGGQQLGGDLLAARVGQVRQVPSQLGAEARGGALAALDGHVAVQLPHELAEPVDDDLEVVHLASELLRLLVITALDVLIPDAAQPVPLQACLGGEVLGRAADLLLAVHLKHLLFRGGSGVRTENQPAFSSNSCELPSYIITYLSIKCYYYNLGLLVR